ncbi:hypothetical protein FGB62_5g549 [Gracilaria domingensis]|nr:hypothetical protein FGB62_5g549 [Gracilaria domingensis]
MIWSVLVITEGALRVVTSNPSVDLFDERPPSFVPFLGGLFEVTFGLLGLFIGMYALVLRRYNVRFIKICMVIQTVLGSADGGFEPESESFDHRDGDIHVVPLLSRTARRSICLYGSLGQRDNRRRLPAAELRKQDEGSVLERQSGFGRSVDSDSRRRHKLKRGNRETGSAVHSAAAHRCTSSVYDCDGNFDDLLGRIRSASGKEGTNAVASLLPDVGGALLGVVSELYDRSAGVR